MKDACRSFPPAVSGRPEILILGSMPGVESLRQAQYYAFPRNAFWKITGTLFHFDPALPYAERLAALNARGVALWDTLAACERRGSGDTSIRNAVPNAVPELLEKYPSIRRIFCNGRTSAKYLFQFFPELKEKTEILPSTSPAAAMFSYEKKLELWRTALSSWISFSSWTADSF